jgi:hypothetical protein
MVLSDWYLEAACHPETFKPVQPDFDVPVVVGHICESDIGCALRTVAGLAAGKHSATSCQVVEHCWDPVSYAVLSAPAQQGSRVACLAVGFLGID